MSIPSLKTILAAAEVIFLEHEQAQERRNLAESGVRVESIKAIDLAIAADCSADGSCMAGEASEAFLSGISERDFLISILDLLEEDTVIVAVDELKGASLWPWA